jgi:hypothetical protein
MYQADTTDPQTQQLAAGDVPPRGQPPPYEVEEPKRFELTEHPTLAPTPILRTVDPGCILSSASTHSACQTT